MCTFNVLSEMFSSVAMCLLDKPWETRAITWDSRRVRGSVSVVFSCCLSSLGVADEVGDIGVGVGVGVDNAGIVDMYSRGICVDHFNRISLWPCSIFSSAICSSRRVEFIQSCKRIN